MRPLLVRLLAWATLATSLAQADGTARSAQMPLTLARVNESFHQAVGVVVAQVLRDLGHPVRVVEGPHAQIYPRFARGEIDLFSGSWLPNGHRTYWVRYGQNFERVGVLYEGARFYWAVPSYVPEHLVNSLDDLTRPEVRARLDREVQGVVAGSGLMRLSREAMTRYGLTAAGYRLRDGDVPILARHVQAGLEARRWFVTPLWTPQFLNAGGRLRPLADPRGVFGRSDQAFLLAHRGVSARLPARTLQVLRRVHLGLTDVTELDAAINVRGATPEAAARAWIRAHPGVVRAWRGE